MRSKECEEEHKEHEEECKEHEEEHKEHEEECYRAMRSTRSGGWQALHSTTTERTRWEPSTERSVRNMRGSASRLLERG